MGSTVHQDGDSKSLITSGTHWESVGVNATPKAGSYAIPEVI